MEIDCEALEEELGETDTEEKDCGVTHCKASRILEMLSCMLEVCCLRRLISDKRSSMFLDVAGQSEQDTEAAGTEDTGGEGAEGSGLVTDPVIPST